VLGNPPVALGGDDPVPEPEEGNPADDAGAEPRAVGENNHPDNENNDIEMLQL